MDAVEAYSKLNESLQRAGRSISDICVVAVSKKQSVERVQNFLAKDLEHEALGESFLQELQEKKRLLSRAGVQSKFHFVGRLQSRKISEICEQVDCIHSVARLKEWELIRDWNQNAGPGSRIDYFLQINVSAEPSKNGVSPSEIKTWDLETLNKDPQFSGLMAMPEPIAEVGEEKVREQIIVLRKIRDEFFPTKKLNVGTTNDFTIAIEEGSQVIRLGSCLFGPRDAGAR